MSKKAIKFSASWCHPCKMYAPIWDKVKSETEGWEFEEVDVDSNMELASNHGIKAVPTTVFSVEDKEVYRKSGLMSAKDLKDILQKNN